VPINAKWISALLIDTAVKQLWSCLRTSLCVKAKGRHFEHTLSE